MEFKKFFKKFDNVHAVFLLILFGFLAYASAINHPFVHDDVVFVKLNPNIADLNLKHIFTQTVFHNPNFPLVNTYYRPFLELFNRILYKLFGLWAPGYHLTNIFFHIINSILVFFLARLIFVKNRLFGFAVTAISFCTAAVFLLHPVQNEAVACVSGISNLLTVFFLLISFYLYVRMFSFSYDKTLKNNDKAQKERINNSNFKNESIMLLTDSQVRNSPLLSRHLNKLISSVQKCIKENVNINIYFISLFIFLIALMSKEQAIIFPVMIILYELCFSPKGILRIKRTRAFISGYVIVLLLYLLFRKILFGNALTSMTIFNEEFIYRIMSIPRTLLMYLSIIFFPRGLHYYRNTDMIGPFILPLILLIIIFAGIFYIIKLIDGKEKKLAIFGIGLFFAGLLPMLNIVPLVNEYSLLLTSEHFLYLPIIGMLFFVFSVLYFIFNKYVFLNKYYLKEIVFIFICGIFIAVNIKLNSYWESEIKLFDRTLKYEKNFGRVRILLARAYYNDGQYHKAIEEYLKAYKIINGYFTKVIENNSRQFYLRFLLQVHIDTAICYENLGDFKSAISWYERALALQPDNSVLYFNMGISSLKMNDINNAIKYFELALKVNSMDLMSANSLAICYAETGQFAKAKQLLEFILQKDPVSQSAKENLKLFLLEHPEI